MGYSHAARRLGLALLLTLSVLAIGQSVKAPNVSVRAVTQSPVSTTLSPSYDMVGSDGGIFTFGNAGFWGSMGGTTLNQPVVGMAATSTGQGYWLVASDGGIFTFGDAQFHGSMGGTALNQPVVGMAADPATGGYWMVASDGGVFSFDAPFLGSMGGKSLNQPIVGMAATPDGNGYWLVASDGGIFAFGDAQFYGSMGGTTLNKPVVGMAATPDGKGYWLVASDGGIFTFGDAQFHGSMGGTALNKPVVGMAADPATGGYWMVASDGGVFSFDAPFFGSMGGTALNKPVVGIAQTYSMNPYSTGMYGADISWPQCSDSPLNPITQFPANNGVGVVGATTVSSITAGSAFPAWSQAFATNPCLGSEFKMAQASGAHVSLYTVLWSPSAPTSGDTQLFTGPEGTCASTVPLTSTTALDCQAYDWGYNIALAAIAYASSQGAYSNLWWLDVEMPGNNNVLFGTDTSANDNVISGAVYALKTLGYQVGIYSTRYQFTSIAGSGYSPGVPIWIATGDTVSSLPSYCTASNYFFGGGTPWLIQGKPIPIDPASASALTPPSISNVDPDYAC